MFINKTVQNSFCYMFITYLIYVKILNFSVHKLDTIYSQILNVKKFKIYVQNIYETTPS